MRLLDLFCGAGGAANEARFWSYVERRGPDDCWLWKGSSRRNGYGQLNIAKYPHKAHRLAYALTHGEPGELSVLHRCDTPACVNPAHLFLGTQRDNMRDASIKGRVRGKVSPGEQNGQAKLTSKSVIEARKLHLSGWSFHRLAKHFSVNRKTITEAVKGVRWRDV